MEVTDDCAVPEQQALDTCCCMPAVVEMEWNDGPPKDVTFEGDLLSPGPESQELRPQPEQITTHAGRAVKPSLRLNDYVCNQRKQYCS